MLNYYTKRNRYIKAIWSDGREKGYETLINAVKDVHIEAKKVRQCIREEIEYKGFTFFEITKEEYDQMENKYEES